MAAKDCSLAPRCNAFSKSTGRRCKQPAIRGGAVCIVHGGSSPQAKAAAQLRIACLVDPALEVMFELLTSKSTPAATRYSVVKDVLDRTGHKPVEKIETTQLWDGDLAKLNEDQLAAMANYFWNFVDPAKRAELQRRTLEIEGPVIEAEFVSVPEEKTARVEEKGGW